MTFYGHDQISTRATAVTTRILPCRSGLWHWANRSRTSAPQLAPPGASSQARHLPSSVDWINLLSSRRCHQIAGTLVGLKADAASQIGGTRSMPPSANLVVLRRSPAYRRVGASQHAGVNIADGRLTACQGRHGPR